MRRVLLPAALLQLLAACGPTGYQQEGPSKVPPDGFALVGTGVLSRALLSQAEVGERTQFADRVVRDELFRQEALARTPFRSHAAERGVLARRLMQDVEREVRTQTPTTASEVEQAYSKNWLKFDRPRAVRTVLVMFPVSPPEDDKAQRLRAERMHRAVQGSHNPREFDEAAAKAFPKDEVKNHARVYEMPPLAADGRIVPLQPDDFKVTGVSATLASAMGALTHPGDISEVVPSEEGYLIFFVTAVYPPEHVPLETARTEIERTIQGARVKARLDKITADSKNRVVRRRSDLAQLLAISTSEL